MRRPLLALVVAMFAAAAPFAQQSGSQQAPPPAAPKADAKPATGVAGKWTVLTDAGQGPLESALELKLEGTKVSGTISSQMGTAPIAGEYTEGKLTFTLTMQGGSGSVEIWFGGALKADGTMAGTLDFGQGEIPWTAKRTPDKAPN